MKSSTLRCASSEPPTISLLIRIHVHVVLLPLLSLPFPVPPLSNDALWVELGHGILSLTAGKMCAGQAHMREPSGGDIVQELLIAFLHTRDATSKLAYSTDGIEHGGDFIHLRSDTGHKIGAFPSDVTSGLHGRIWDWLPRQGWSGWFVMGCRW